MKISKKWVVFDCEGDGLKPTKFYCLSWKDKDGNKGTITRYDEIRDFFQKYEMYVGHNIRRWDLPNLRRVVGIDNPKSDTRDYRVVDTLSLSWYLEPERKRNGLEYYGEDFGVPKPKIVDWHNQKLSDYIFRCEQDVEINFRLFEKQMEKLLSIYVKEDQALRFLKYLDFKMESAALAEESGWKLDIQKAKEALNELTTERDTKVEALARAMPKVPVVSTYVKPKRLYNADGQLSLLGQRWQDRLNEAGLPEEYDGTLELITGYDDANPGSSVQIKDWLYSIGWKPQTIKFVKNKKTGETKEVPQINKEHGAGICESIKLLYEKEPSLELLDGLSILNHRIGLLTGFLRDVDSDGNLHACVAGLTNTLRFKHTEIVNLPKPEKEYGEFIRGVLIASDDDHELCGSDMASVEDRIKQHYIFPFDPDYVHELNRPDYDPHLDLAFLAGALTKEQVDGYKSEIKDIVKIVKPIRSIYKNGNYACQYGAGIPRLEITCGCDRATAARVHATYWKRNWAIKAVAKAQTVKTVDGQMWLKNPVNGFWYSLRTEKDIFSTLVQGTAAYVFDRYLAAVLSKRPQVTGQFHDEFILNVRKGNRELITKFLNDCIQEVNDSLRLNRELGISIQFGDKYSDIH